MGAVKLLLKRIVGNCIICSSVYNNIIRLLIGYVTHYVNVIKNCYCTNKL